MAVISSKKGVRRDWPPPSGVTYHFVGSECNVSIGEVLSVKEVDHGFGKEGYIQVRVTGGNTGIGDTAFLPWNPVSWWEDPEEFEK